MLYHKDIYMPESKPEFAVLLAYSEHAREQARVKRIHNLPTVLDTRAAELIELETDDRGKGVKAVYRMPHTPFEDLVIVVSLLDRAVRTVWTNDVRDRHATLDDSRYATK